MSKKILLALMLVFLSLPASAATAPAKQQAAAAQQAQPLRGRIGIAAVVNDEVVTFSDVYNRTQLYLLGSPGAPPPEVRKKMEQQVMSKLIDERLQLQEAKNLGIKIEDAQVDEGFAQLAAQNKLQPQEFSQKLAASGIKVSTLREKIKSEVAWSMVVRRKLRAQVNISESEIDNEMSRMEKDKGKTEYSVAEIMLPVTSAQTENLVRQDAGKIVDQLTGGASFSQVARQFSQSPGAAQGGDLGWVQPGQLEPALDKAIASMEPGQISPPIKTDKGYHILFLRDKREVGSTKAAAEGQPQQPPAAPPTVAAAAAPVSQAAPKTTGDVVHLMQIEIPIGKADPQPIVAAKVSRAESLKQEISSCDDMTAKAKDFLTQGTGDLGRQPVSSLNPLVQKAISDVTDGELTQPVRTPDGVAVLMVCDREKGEAVAAAPVPAPAPAAPAPAPKQQAAAPAPAATGNNEASRDEIANRLGRQRLEALADRYLKDLRATAYIETRI